MFGEEGRPYEEDDFVVTKQDQAYTNLTECRRKAMLDKSSASSAARSENYPSDEDFTKAGANTLHRTSTNIKERRKFIDKL